MVVLCCIVVVTGFLPSPVSRSSLSSPPSQVICIALRLCAKAMSDHCWHRQQHFWNQLNIFGWKTCPNELKLQYIFNTDY